ncbi:MAG TPA: glycosyltransferase [Alphaproteobacteria bacterium]|nr:glycosyltransferase [Alphaproteobacteria bacterium]
MSAIVASVIMCTANRLQLATKCLDSVLAQRDVDMASIEVIVVDNSPTGYFRPTVDARQGGTAEVIYLHEPVPSIARARNAGCRQARGRFVVFIDDDERADANWLSHLLRAAEQYNADAVYGPVQPEFEAGEPPVWDRNAVCFRRGFDLPEGALLPMAATNNLLLRRGSGFNGPEPFDLRYGRTGGSDTALTYRLARNGGRIVWCPHAVVHEFIPDKRADLRDNLFRVLVRTQSYVRIQLENETRARRIMRGGWLLVKGGAGVLFNTPRLLFSFVAPHRNAFRLRAPFYQSVGILTWPIRLRLY